MCYLSCSNQSPAFWPSGSRTGAQQVPWSAVALVWPWCGPGAALEPLWPWRGPGVGLAWAFAPPSFLPLLCSPGACSPLLSWAGSPSQHPAVVQSCCTSSQLEQRFLPSGSSSQLITTLSMSPRVSTSSRGSVLWRPLARLPGPGLGPWTSVPT